MLSNNVGKQIWVLQINANWTEKCRLWESWFSWIQGPPVNRQPGYRPGRLVEPCFFANVEKQQTKQKPEPKSKGKTKPKCKDSQQELEKVHHKIERIWWKQQQKYQNINRKWKVKWNKKLFNSEVTQHKDKKNGNKKYRENQNDTEKKRTEIEAKQIRRRKVQKCQSYIYIYIYVYIYIYI